MPDLLISSDTLNGAITHARQEVSTLVNEVQVRLGNLEKEAIADLEAAALRVIDILFNRLEGLSLTIPGISTGIPATTIRIGGKK